MGRRGEEGWEEEKDEEGEEGRRRSGTEGWEEGEEEEEGGGRGRIVRFLWHLRYNCTLYWTHDGEVNARSRCTNAQS